MSSATATTDIIQIDDRITAETDLNLSTTTTTILQPTTTTQQITQWLYIQTPPKVSTTTINKTHSIVKNSLPPLQMSSKKIAVPILHPVNNNTSIKPQRLILQKPSSVPTYITMLQPSSQVVTSSSKQKFVIAPMPQLTSNRLPATMTTNCVQSKIALMPITSKLINLQLENDLIINKQEENDNAITLNIPDDSSDKSTKIKHGASILKKNFNVDKNLVSDDLKINNNRQKNERRRKPNVSYRKDYDDEIIVTTNTLEEKSYKMKPKVQDDVVKIKPIESKLEVKVNDDPKQILNWENGVGTLPGSDIKFQINEFGFLEYVKKEERVEVKPNVIEHQNTRQEEMRCLECGCYGTSSEFINPRFCSYDCQDNHIVKPKKEIKLKRKRNWKKCNEVEKEELPSEEDSTSNENSQDKSNCPWVCTKKGFSWAKYLEHIKAKAVPDKFFKDPFPYNRNGFRPGMKLEGIDPLHPKFFCVLSVNEVLGYRMKLHFDGYSENYDFWVNADSMDIFPPGWCEKYGHVLHTPPGYSRGEFNWTTYLKQTRGAVAPKHLFANRAGSAICPNGFRIGMKLEAVDRKNTSLVCVATVVDMMDNRILVHFDSWDNIYDYWADPTSPYIHPVGWCDQNGHNLTPPNNHPNPTSFTWEKYLKETKSVAAPVRAFKQRPVYGFKKGMRLECVDKKVPQLIRAATIYDIKEHQLLIKYDGWRDRYNCWVENDSSDIHPIGWCQKTGHPIEPPLTPDDFYDSSECPTVGCRGQGNFRGLQYSTHSMLRDCPYAEQNLDRKFKLPDRLLSPDRQLESVVPVSREPKEKIKPPKMGRPPKMPRLEPSPKLSWNDDDCSKPKIKSEASSESNSTERESIKEQIPLTNGYVGSYTEQIWEKHTRHLTRQLINKNPRIWKVEDVVQFINSLPYIENHSFLFKEHQIDGEALLMLSQKDLVDILNIKLGPAIKLYSIIVLLRRKLAS